MSLTSTLRLDRLELRNFRCFAECAVEIHPDLTVLVADNGHGKTALLDAAALALSTFVDTVSGASSRRGFLREDVRLAYDGDGHMTHTLPTSFAARGKLDGHRVSWNRAVNRVGRRPTTTWAGANRAERLAHELRARLDGFVDGGRADAPLLPLVALYGTGRLWNQEVLTERRRGWSREPMDRLSGYIDCLTPSSSFKAFAAWYENMVATIDAGATYSATTQGQKVQPHKLLAAVRDATRVVLEPTGWHSIDWGRDEELLVAEHPDHGRLPLSFLSDGVRNMVALVADVAHRCARLNPHFGTEAARMTPGILLIDEVDMHLHPRWQQQVLGLLRKAFPAMQLVVTTHSPQVLSTVDVESIRIVRHADGVGTLVHPRFQTLGVESADVMAEIMGVDPTPRVPEAIKMSRYRALIEDGHANSDGARVLRHELVDHFGAQHPLMVQCDRLIRFQAFKLRKATGQTRSDT